MFKDQKSTGSGLVFLAIGGGLVLYALATLETGTASQMGPGFFPVCIGICLVVTGGLVLLTGGEESRIAFRSWPWREMAIILTGIVGFAVLLRPAGFAPACFLLVLIAAKARRETGWPLAALIAASLTAFCGLVFIGGLGIPFRLFWF